MNSRILRLILGSILIAAPVFLVGCSSGNSASETSGGQSGNVNMMVSDASTEDWAAIGVKILSISLIPQGGGSNVNVYSVAETSAPTINLVQLDQLGEILGTLTVPVGTYTGAVITISGAPADITLKSSADPSAAFLAVQGVGSASTSIATSQIQVQGTSGSPATSTVTITFTSPLVVSANSNSVLDLEFDLEHPGFLVGSTASGAPMWAINFNGPLHHHPIPDLTKFLLRDIYGTVTAVNSDGSLTITRDFPVEPAPATATSETVVSTGRTITILPDSTNGTIFYDVDASTTQTIMTYATVSADLPVGEFVRVAARYQTGGTLVAVRTWASSTFGDIYASPEGHVLHVNTATNTITVENEIGVGIPMTVTNNTVFYDGATQISTTGSGLAFLPNVKRGFKIHASVVNPLAVPLVAQTIDIETARFDGTITAANTSGFTYTRTFATASDNYVVTLPYISASTANGKDPLSGNAITGFKWWDFTFPTIVDSNVTDGSTATAIQNFLNAVSAGISATASFGGTAAAVTVPGESFAIWGDPAATTGWSAPWAVLDPTGLPLGTVAQGYINGSPNGTITMTEAGGTHAVTVDMSTVAGSATLVYQVTRTGTTLTITAEDITTAAGQTAVTTNLITGSLVKVFGVPQANGTIKAYALAYYSGGVTPTAVD